MPKSGATRPVQWTDEDVRKANEKVERTAVVRASYWVCRSLYNGACSCGKRGLRPCERMTDIVNHVRENT